MTPTTSADALERLATRLTPNQRYHVERGCISGDFTMATVESLRRKGLMELVVDSPNGKCGFMELTETGRGVQSILRARAKEASNG